MFSDETLADKLRQAHKGPNEKSVKNYRHWVEDALSKLYESEKSRDDLKSSVKNLNSMPKSLREGIESTIENRQEDCDMHKITVKTYLDKIAEHLGIEHNINFRDSDYNSLTQQLDKYFKENHLPGLISEEEKPQQEVIDVTPDVTRKDKREESPFKTYKHGSIDMRVNESPFTKETAHLKQPSGKDTSYHNRALEVYKAWEQHMSNKRNSAYKNIDELRKDLGVGKNKFYEMVNYIKTNKQLENQNQELPQLEEKIQAYKAYQNLQQEKREDSSLKYWRAAMREDQIAREFGVSRSTFKKYARYIDKIKDLDSPLGHYVSQRI